MRHFKASAGKKSCSAGSSISISTRYPKTAFDTVSPTVRARTKTCAAPLSGFTSIPLPSGSTLTICASISSTDLGRLSHHNAPPIYYGTLTTPIPVARAHHKRHREAHACSRSATPGLREALRWCLVPHRSTIGGQPPRPMAIQTSPLPVGQVRRPTDSACAVSPRHEKGRDLYNRVSTGVSAATGVFDRTLRTTSVPGHVTVPRRCAPEPAWTSPSTNIA